MERLVSSDFPVLMEHVDEWVIPDETVLPENAETQAPMDWKDCRA